MSNEPIYPLPEYDPGDEVPRSVNERLAPIFRALADDPDGWEFEWRMGNKWADAKCSNFFPSRHDTCDDFRLVPTKSKTIEVEIAIPYSVQWHGDGAVTLRFRNEDEAGDSARIIATEAGCNESGA